MQIQVVTMWYNEAFLAPFFLNHYSPMDKINILYDEDTSDETLEICKKFNNVKIIPFHFPDMMDDDIKIDLINKTYKKIEADWVLSVDADEFAFLQKGDSFHGDFHELLCAEYKYNVYKVLFFQVYRNIKDKDLDPNLPTVQQRRHGDPNVLTEINALYRKPALVRGGLDLTWAYGCHDILKCGGGVVAAPFTLPGAHWAMADPAFSIERRLKNRKARQSKNNLEKKLTVQHHNITAKDLISEFKLHSLDPQLF